MAVIRDAVAESSATKADLRAEMKEGHARLQANHDKLNTNMMRAVLAFTAIVPPSC